VLLIRYLDEEAFVGTYHKRSKIVIGSKVIELVSRFNCLGCYISYLQMELRWK